MNGFVPMTATYYVVCLVLVMLAWVFFTLAFVVFRPKTPGGGAAAAPAEGAKPARDRRSLWGVLLQSLGYALMWITFRPPFASLSKFPGPVALVVAASAVALAWTSASFALWAQRTLGKEWSYTARLIEGHRLVTAGPYAIVRHPIYAAMLGLWIATALAVARPYGIVVGIVPMVWGTVLRARIEDSLLRASFGPAFEDWKQKTPAIVPGVV